MALRRVLGLHAKLSAAARQCEAAHGRSLLGLGKGMPGLSTASTHRTAGHALRLAASTFAVENSSCVGRRTFVAQAAPLAPSADTGSSVDLNFTDSAVERLGELAEETSGQPLVLRLTVEGGGCSGFTYLFDLDTASAPDDRTITQGPATLVCDPVSYEFVRGSTIDYTTDLIRSAFEVVSNPNAEASCGCGSSFAPKA